MRCVSRRKIGSRRAVWGDLIVGELPPRPATDDEEKAAPLLPIVLLAVMSPLLLPYNCCVPTPLTLTRDRTVAANLEAAGEARAAALLWKGDIGLCGAYTTDTSPRVTAVSLRPSPSLVVSTTAAAIVLSALAAAGKRRDPFWGDDKTAGALALAALVLAVPLAVLGTTIVSYAAALRCPATSAAIAPTAPCSACSCLKLR